MKEWSHQLNELQFVFVSRTSLNLRIGLQNYVYISFFCPSNLDHKPIYSSFYKVAGGGGVWRNLYSNSKQIRRFGIRTPIGPIDIFWRDNVFGFAGILGVPLWKGDVTWAVLLEM
jgi:hypothetical protein